MAINVALRVLLTPPDRVMVITPCWMDYPLYLANLGLGCDLVPADARKHLNLTAIENAWTPQTRGIIISQPASPTGVCYPKHELDALAATLRRLAGSHERLPVLISDETHRDSIWGGAGFHSPAAAYPQTVSVYSFGKAWQMQGQRIGYLAVNPRHPMRETVRHELVTEMRITGTYAPTALMQHLATAMVGFTPCLDALACHQHRARNALQGAGFHVVNAHATPFVYVQAPTADDERFAAAAADRGVLVMPSTLFHEQGYFRVAINVDGAALDHAVSVLADLNAVGWGM